ncbi:MAG: hypothetical protein EP330_06750 [Deltaproteobacteria bacterium]|nr:MAG: hypothetical protein EP330_06750 [Deltaproteobacteria bacterium]
MNAADYATTRSLRDHLERAVTGKLTVGRGARTASVYLMNGAIMGAETSNDASLLLRRLTVERVLDEGRATELLISAQDGESIYGPLFEEVDGAALETILHERFKDALADWLAAGEEPVFTSMAAVFIDNLQMGVQADQVIGEALEAIDKVATLPDDALLASGSGMPRGKAELSVRALLRRPTEVGDLVQMLPLEPWAARVVIADMVERGGLKLQMPAAVPDEGDAEGPAFDAEHASPEADADLEPSHAPSGEDELRDIETEQLETEQMEPETEQIEPFPDRAGFGFGNQMPVDDEFLSAFEDADDDSEEFDRLLTADIEPVSEEVEVELDKKSPMAGFDFPEVDDEFAGAFDDESEEYVPPEPAPVSSAPEAPISFDTGAEEDSEVINAFNDANEFRGGARDAGHFVTESHNLDRVSLGGDVDEDQDLEFEAEEVPAQSFSAPRLSEVDAQHKIDVANSVLEVIAAEYDKAQGPGAGRAAVQLLVDGSPLKFASLFKDVTANNRGCIMHHEVLRNLYSRPPTEHRQLLQDGVKNLLDRGMSIAADELPDEGIDAVLEASAGLRQRLGL